MKRAVPTTPTRQEPEPLDVPEIHAAHASHPSNAVHGGRPWLDMVVAVAALVTSVVSITVAVRHGVTMEKLVEAQSWPHVELDSSNLVDGKANVALTLRSSGSGPSKVKALSISYAGIPVHNWPELIRACCASDRKADVATLLRETAGMVVTGTPAGQVLLPNDRAMILSLPRTEANAALWKRLDNGRAKLRFEVCFCSVFDECYVSALRRTDARHVETCAIPKDQWES